MKTTLLILAVILTVTGSFAQTKRKIKVVNNQFMPANLNASVGDTILWVWKEGGHTTTSQTIPANAKPWDKPLNSTSKKFKYILKVAGTYHYHCSIHSLSMTGQIVVSAGPVPLFSDISVAEENAKAALKWNIDPSADASYFSVQRSRDGSTFTEIAKLQASSSLTYQYTDQSTLSDKYVYYQVQLVNKSGNSQLSDIKMFTSNVKSSKIITSLSPNPISSPGHLMLQFNADKEGKMLLQLYTSGGELIKQTELTAVKGLNNGHFHLGELKAGSYYLVCTLAGVQEKYTIMYQ